MKRWSNGQYRRHPYMGGLTLLIVTICLGLSLRAYSALASEPDTMVSPVVASEAEDTLAKVPSPTESMNLPEGSVAPKTGAAPTEAERNSTPSASIEDKIRKTWGAEGDNAVKVAFCESSLNPEAAHAHSSAKGLFQIIKGTWKGYKCSGDPLNADDNISCAYRIYQANGWGHTSSWAASKGCHGLN